MTRFLLILSLVILSPEQLWADLRLLSTNVYNGEVTALRWQGKPLSFGVARFIDQIIYYYPDTSGAIALLPVGLDVPAGSYPVLTAVVDRKGRTISKEFILNVKTKDRPIEHLTLPESMVTPSNESLMRINHDRKVLEDVFDDISPRAWTIFQLPVDSDVSSIFGKRRTMNGKARAPHSGTDYRSTEGTPVRSMSNGRIVLVEDLFYTGKTVVVDHGEGLFSLYAHLSKTHVEKGHELLAGDVLGEVGSTGRSTGAHLHVTTKLLGVRVDPESLLKLFK